MAEVQADEDGKPAVRRRNLAGESVVREVERSDEASELGERLGERAVEEVGGDVEMGEILQGFYLGREWAGD